jgi:hypothetical protein
MPFADGGGFTRVASIVSGQMSVMEPSFDREVGYRWRPQRSPSRRCILCKSFAFGATAERRCASPFVPCCCLKQ